MRILIQAPRFYKKGIFIFLKFQFYDLEKLGKNNSRKLAKLIKLILPKKIPIFFLGLNNRILSAKKNKSAMGMEGGSTKGGEGVTTWYNTPLSTWHT